MKKIEDINITGKSREVWFFQVPVQMLSHLAMVEDHVRAMYLPHVRYITDRVESGNARVMVEYSTDLSHVNATVVTPVSGYEYVRVPLHRRLFEGMDKPMSYPHWHFMMDNTRFPVTHLHKMMQGQISESLFSDKSLFVTSDIKKFYL